MKRLTLLLALVAVTAVALVVWHDRDPRITENDQPGDPSPGTSPATVSSGFPNPCALAFTAHAGSGRVDREIIRLQEAAGRANDSGRELERLGWMFVAKARESFDPGYYKLAEACALCLDARRPGSLEAMLLRGHVLHNIHRFHEAEPLARELAARRGLAADFGLLGDVLMELGRIEEAIAAYQKMVDLKPDLHAYARAAHMRWLKGDLHGAVELMQMAASAASPQDRESAAWIHTRLASLQWQSGAVADSRANCAAALDFQNDYPPALLLRGRTLLADGKSVEAVEALRRASELNPLPEYQWTLVEALRDAGEAETAGAVEAQLARTGAAADPRTFALYLATRGESVETALRLTEKELQERSDVFTHDARAWALAAAGRWTEALDHLGRALAAGTEDARLLFHAAVITSKAGLPADAQWWFERATDQMHLLLPGEQEQLALAADNLDASATDTDFVPSGTTTFPLRETETSLSKGGKSSNQQPQLRTERQKL